MYAIDAIGRAARFFSYALSVTSAPIPPFTHRAAATQCTKWNSYVVNIQTERIDSLILVIYTLHA